jgi:Carboxypeptidase regulatory-like domain
MALAILLTGALRLSAQVLYGSLTGTVTDASEAVLPNAQITVLETQTGVSQSQTTDSAGIYRFPALLPGSYKVTITATGFSTQEPRTFPWVQTKFAALTRISV